MMTMTHKMNKKKIKINKQILTRFFSFFQSTTHITIDDVWITNEESVRKKEKEKVIAIIEEKLMEMFARPISI